MATYIILPKNLANIIMLSKDMPKPARALNAASYMQQHSGWQIIGRPAMNRLRVTLHPPRKNGL
jgi:hypothetical protein